MTDGDDVFLPTTQHVIALTTLVSVLIGLLRVRGVLDDSEVEAVFDIADQLLPDRALPHGPQLMSVVRNTQAQVQSDEDC